MLAISDPWEGSNQRSADQTEVKVTDEGQVRKEADKPTDLKIMCNGMAMLKLRE